MIRYLILGLLLVPSVALALDVILQIDGQTIRSIDADRVNIITDDQRQLIDIRTKPKSPDPVEPPPPQPGACKRSPGVFVEDTGSLTARYAIKAFRPSPATIVAFRVTTPATGTHTGRATAVRSSESERVKLITVSECPGDYKNPIAKTNACVSLGVEASQVTLTTNPNADKRFQCVLERGATYYINAVSVSGFNNDAKSCTTTADCSFWFERDPS